jgi:hypothetical protein
MRIASLLLTIAGFLVASSTTFAQTCQENCYNAEAQGLTACHSQYTSCTDNAFDNYVMCITIVSGGSATCAYFCSQHPNPSFCYAVCAAGGAFTAATCGTILGSENTQCGVENQNCSAIVTNERNACLAACP